MTQSISNKAQNMNNNSKNNAKFLYIMNKKKQSLNKILA